MATTPQTYFGSGLRSGSTTLSDTVDGGYVSLIQQANVTSVSNGNADVTIKVPVNAHIIRIWADKIVDWSVGAGTATTLNASVGKTAGGADYMVATNLASATNTSGPTTIATNLACESVGTDTTIYFRLATNGTVLTTQAQVSFHVLYYIP